LIAATNVDTGNLDLSRFSREIRDSGLSLADYRDSLWQLGREGERAFTNLAKSVTLSEIPLRRNG
jgi:hypothetical protein